MNRIRKLKEFAKHALRNRGWDLTRCQTLGTILRHHDVDLVIDVGANDGGYVRSLRRDGWKGDISSVEPQPEAFRRLYAAMQGDTRWKGFHYGLGDKTTEMEMYIHAHDVLSSFLEKIEPDEGTQRVMVPVRRLDECYGELVRGHHRPFIKLDTQGFEKAILSGAGDILSKVVGWQMELSVNPLYEGQPKFQDMVALMATRGFSLWYIMPGLRDPRTLRIYEFDGLFFRDQAGGAIS